MSSSKDSKYRFQDKRVVVIGGTSGIGLAACQQLVQEGALVIALGRSQEKCEAAKKKFKAHFEALAVNIHDATELTKIFQYCDGFDHLVLTATGGERAFGPFLEMKLSGFKGSFDKLWGYANAIQCGVPHMKSSPSSSVVVVSGSPARKCKPGFVALSCVGASVENLVKALAKEITPIRINAVSPGLIDTPMFDGKGDQKQDFLKQSTKDNPIPRAGKPDEVAKGILFCLDNDFMTGTIVDVDGGAAVP